MKGLAFEALQLSTDQRGVVSSRRFARGSAGKEAITPRLEAIAGRLEDMTI